MPSIVPLGDGALLVRFGSALSDAANRAAIALAAALDRAPIAGVVEIMPNLISVLLRYDPSSASPAAIQGELRLVLWGLADQEHGGRDWVVPVRFDGPDLAETAQALALSVPDFIARHNGAWLRLLATGFAPGFVYCGMHERLNLPRRAVVRPMVPAGSILFAAGQTAITATPMPTGWHVIGGTPFRNFDPAADPPTQMRAGDRVRFEIAS